MHLHLLFFCAKPFTIVIAVIVNRYHPRMIPCLADVFVSAEHLNPWPLIRETLAQKSSRYSMSGPRPLRPPESSIFPNLNSNIHPFDLLDPFSIRRCSSSAIKDDVAARPPSYALIYGAPLVNPSASAATTIPAQDRKKFLCQPDEVIRHESDYLVVYTDGACAMNGYPGARAGSGVFWLDFEQRGCARRC